MMSEDIDKSYSELIERIKAETRTRESVMPVLIKYFEPMLFPKRSGEKSISKKFKNLLSFSEKSTLNSIDDLLHQLESKKIISKTNTSQLQIVVEKLNSKILEIAYKNHNELIVKVNKSDSIVTKQEIDNSSEKLNEQVRETICQSISKRWVDLGRQISMPDERLDQIEHKYGDFWRRASKVLDYFEANTPRAEQGPKLYDALIAAKRKDLAEKIMPLLQESR